MIVENNSREIKATEDAPGVYLFLLSVSFIFFFSSFLVSFNSIFLRERSVSLEEWWKKKQSFPQNDTGNSTD